eukprot:g4871.t1
MQVAAVWQNVCTEDAYQQYRKELCPPTFPVSVLAYNPTGKGVELTIILRPSITLKQVANSVKPVAIEFRLPGFGLPSNLKPHPTDPNKRQIEVTGTNQVALGANPATSYNTNQNGLFETPAYFDFVAYVLELKAKDKYEILHTSNANLELCCFTLPAELPENPVTFTLIAKELSYVPNELGTEPTNSYTLPESGTPQQIKAVPQIFRVNFFTHVEVRFDPALSNAQSVVSIKLQVNAELRNGARIVAFLPDLTRNPLSDSWQEFLTSSSSAGLADMTGNVGFQTEGSDWVLFEYFAQYNATSKALTFFLRTDSVLPPNKMITFKTIKDDFMLPNSLPSNSARLQVAAFSYDGVDEVIAPTPVFQSDRVFLRLPGFSAEVIEVPLVGDYIEYFRNKEAVFDLARNELAVKVIRTLYSQSPNLIDVTFVDLQIPPAMYENDMSLLIWNRDWDGVESPQRSIMASNAINGGRKEFTRSEIKFSPREPDVVSNVTFTILPSIVFYQGDEVLLYLYGFRCSSREITLTGADAYRFEAYDKHSRGDWTQDTYTLTLRVREGHILSNTKATVFRIEINQGFRLPDKLSENDGILNIEGRGAYIAKEMLKKTPKLGGQKYITNSQMVFESADGPQGSLSNSIARVMFNFKSNSDIRPNSTIIITMGGLTRDVDTANGEVESGVIRLSGKNAPMFAYGNVESSGFWDSVTSELRATIIPNLDPVPAGVETIFFIEIDQRFKLPFAMYLNDPSLKISIPAAGIPEQFFNFTTRVNDVGKQFTESQLTYGSVGDKAHPGSAMDITIEFSTNVALPSGTTIRLTLPGAASTQIYRFTCPLLQPKLEPPPGESLLHYSYFSRRTVQVTTTTGQVLDVIEYYADWDPVNEHLDLTLRPGQSIPSNQVHKMTIKSSTASRVFRLPREKMTNDPSLRIETISKQIITDQPIRSSQEIVDRSFRVSTFTYDPRNARSTFMMNMIFQPTVPIGTNDAIVLRLYGFTNALQASVIHLTGPDAAMIEGSKAQWNPTTQDLTIKIAQGQVLAANQTLSLTIQESQGFQLPATLNQNDPELKVPMQQLLVIRSGVNNIYEAPVKNSPMVGDGPHQHQRFCMYQYMTGPAGKWAHGAVVPFKVRGFQLVASDRVGFVPLDEQCPSLPENFITFVAGNTFGSQASGSSGTSGTSASSRMRRSLEKLALEDPELSVDLRGHEVLYPDAALEHATQWIDAEVGKHERILRRLNMHAANLRKDRALRRRSAFFSLLRRELRGRLLNRRTSKMYAKQWQNQKCESSPGLMTCKAEAKEVEKHGKMNEWLGVKHWTDLVESRELDEMIFVGLTEVISPGWVQPPGLGADEETEKHEHQQKRKADAAKVAAAAVIPAAEPVQAKTHSNSKAPRKYARKLTHTEKKKLQQSDKEIEVILDQLDKEILRRISVAHFGDSEGMTPLDFSVATEKALEDAAYEMEKSYWAASVAEELPSGSAILENADVPQPPRMLDAVAEGKEELHDSAEEDVQAEESHGSPVRQLQTATTTIDPLTQYRAFLSYDPFAELAFFSNYTSRELSQGADELTFHDVTGLETGFYRICFQHFSEIFDVGMVIMRPSCPPGKVAVDGTVCVTHCPPNTIPVAGRCENMETYGYSDPTHFITATLSQLRPGRPGPIFIEPGTNLTSTADVIATSEAEALAQNVMAVSQVTTASSDDASQASAAPTSPDADPNMQLNMVGHRTNPFLNGTTYTATTTKGGVEDVYSRTLMVPIKMSSPEAVSNMIWNRSDEHPERKYYVYRFTYELAQLLGVSSESFVVASISEARTGTGNAATTEGVIINTIFAPSGDANARTADELLQLLQALQTDIQSSLHDPSNFFKNIFRDFTLRSIFVSLCPDNIYRSICPYMDSIMDSDIGFIIYVASVFGIALMLALFVFGAWLCDHDPADTKKDDKKFFDKASKEPTVLDPGLQNEYARSWLEGRYMGEEV